MTNNNLTEKAAHFSTTVRWIVLGAWIVAMVTAVLVAAAEGVGD